jgi:hypothetical protein
MPETGKRREGDGEQRRNGEAGKAVRWGEGEKRRRGEEAKRRRREASISGIRYPVSDIRYPRYLRSVKRRNTLFVIRYTRYGEGGLEGRLLHGFEDLRMEGHRSLRPKAAHYRTCLSGGSATTTRERSALCTKGMILWAVPGGPGDLWRCYFTREDFLGLSRISRLQSSA